MTFYGFLVSTTKDPHKWWGQKYKEYVEFEKTAKEKFGCDYCGFSYAGDYLRNRTKNIKVSPVSVPVVPEATEVFGYTGISGEGKAFQIREVLSNICDTTLFFFVDGRLLSAKEFCNLVKKSNMPLYIYALAYYHN